MKEHSCEHVLWGDSNSPVCILFPYIATWWMWSSTYAALRGAATLKARALKEMRNITAVTPLDRSIGIGMCGKTKNSNSSTSDSGEIINGENFLGACNLELLARGSELLKRTRKGNVTYKCSYVLALTLNLFSHFAKRLNFILVLTVGDLHWKVVSVYIHRSGQVIYLFYYSLMELDKCPFITIFATICISGDAENKKQACCRNHY